MFDSRIPSRRTFLQHGLTAGALLFVPAAQAFQAHPKFTANPFTLGVASGDPWPDSVVLWTRLAPDPIHGGGMPRESVAVDWRVATDEQMKRVVAKGTAVAEAAWAHSVHVDVRGLEADRWYWYQFSVGTGPNRVLSPVARTRTAPATAAKPDRFAFASRRAGLRSTTSTMASRR